MRKVIKAITLISCFIIYEKYNGQTSSQYIEIEWKNGSDAAKKIMKSDFYYDILDAWSPFGNDIGNDTYHLYCDWKQEHSNGNIREFLAQELISLGYPGFDLSIDDNPDKLKSIVNTMRNQFLELNAIDNIVISLAFSQLFLEGHIEPEVKKWAEAAFSREAVYLDFWSGEEGEMQEREKRMKQLLSDLRKG